MPDTRTVLNFASDLGLDAVVVADGDRLIAGFVPDLATAAFDAQSVVLDSLGVLSPVVTERQVSIADGDRETQLRIFIGRTGSDARIALAASLALITRPLFPSPADRTELDLGDFTLRSEGADRDTFLAFGQSNIVVSLLNGGPDPVDLRSQAISLLRQLASCPRYDEGGIAALRPQFSAAYLAARRIDPDSSVPLALAARCPQGLPLRFEFETTHGSVEPVSMDPPRFTYSTGDAFGFQALTVYAVSAGGLTTTVRIEFSIGGGDLGREPGLVP